MQSHKWGTRHGTEVLVIILVLLLAWQAVFYLPLRFVNLCWDFFLMCGATPLARVFQYNTDMDSNPYNTKKSYMFFYILNKNRYYSKQCVASNT